MTSGWVSERRPLRLRLGQVDVDALLHQRRGDHEDDQQHEHDVDERRHVDLGELAPLAAAVGDVHAARDAVRRSTSANSAPNVSSRSARRFSRRARVVVADRRGDRGGEPERGRDQRLGDARGDRRQLRRARLTDRLERIHDADHGPEQADERARARDRGQEREPAFEPVHLFALDPAEPADHALDLIARDRRAPALQLLEPSQLGVARAEHRRERAVAVLARDLVRRFERALEVGLDELLGVLLRARAARETSSA